jgi:citrate synthase
MSEVVSRGLEGIVVADSGIAFIDGEQGVLRYRGIDIGDLSVYSSYEETAYLLWHGRLPSESQLDDFRARLASNRQLDPSVWRMLTSFPCWPVPMEALRTSVSALSSCDPYAGDDSPEANLNKAMYLAAKMPTIIAHYHRYSSGEEPLPPDPGLGHAANFLYMLNGEVPSPTEERAMDLVMILLAEHGLNASTFGARVTASTLSDLYSTITSAVGVLKGALHGGANQRAMEMLLEIREVEAVEEYVSNALAAKRRIMGFGHRVYRTIDPRAVHLRDMVCTLGAEASEPHWCQLSMRVNEVVEEKKPGIYPNVDFFSAPLLYTLGVPPDLYTPVFAMSRVVGWTAHVMEQYGDNRLIRPRSNYTGPERISYVPMAERGL